MSMIPGVLLAGGFHTYDELRLMSREDRRNTLIVVLTNLSNGSNYQQFDDHTLAGMGAVMVLLRHAGIRDDAALKTMSVEDQRNTLIVELQHQTQAGIPQLQALRNMQLVSLMLGSSLLSSGAVNVPLPTLIRGALLAGRFRTQRELNTMSVEDQRNTLIVELTNWTNQSNFQSFTNEVLEGMGAVLVFLRAARVRSDAELQAMSAEDQRNTLIAFLGAKTGLGRELQRLTSLDLVLLGLGDNDALTAESDAMHAIMGTTHSRYAGVYGVSHGSGIGIHGKGGRLAGYFEGDVEVTGDIRLSNADCAEDFSVTAGQPVEPGTVMVLDDSGLLQPSSEAFDTRVVGVISGAGTYRPALILNRRGENQELRQPIALIGKVYCKADATHGAIRAGDLLTSSPTPGHAMRATTKEQAFGAVLGKALGPLAAGRGLIPILVALQ